MIVFIATNLAMKSTTSKRRHVPSSFDGIFGESLHINEVVMRNKLNGPLYGRIHNNFIDTVGQPLVILIFSSASEPCVTVKRLYGTAPSPGVAELLETPFLT